MIWQWGGGTYETPYIKEPKDINSYLNECQQYMHPLNPFFFFFSRMVIEMDGANSTKDNREQYKEQE